MLKNETESDYLSMLNEAQKRAVLLTNGPVLVLAGAGAGKTKTLTSRILHLIKCGVGPEKILAITFTNKAAQEMKKRVDNALLSDKSINRPITMGERPFISTFHALGLHILKENAQLIGLPRHFSIYDRDDSRKAVKESLELAGFDPKQFEPGRILAAISKEKGKAINLGAYLDKAEKDFMAKVIGETWLRYQKILEQNKALDFDDLLVKALELLQNKKEVLEKYQNKWQFVHVDEYQDTNKVQYVLANLIAKNHQNIFAVGDIDQTIYTWRGAHIKNLLDFEKDYPKAETIILEENYRSTKNILSAANSVIKKNKFRVEKNLFTAKGEGERIGLYASYDENDEASFVAKRAKQLIIRGIEAKEIAVLYRANFQSRALEEAFLSENLPYQVIGTRFFERKEIKDVLSYIKAAVNPEGLADLKRIINTPARGLGKLTILKIFSGKESELPTKTSEKVADFRKMLAIIKKTAESQKPSQLVKIVLRESGLETALKSGTDEDKERLENIHELASLATKYETLPLPEALEKFLSDAALASDQDEIKEDRQAVRLMTVHASKGLEFDYVFISGLEDDLFPHKKIGEKNVTDEESEEERRLFYVALTRARKKLILTYSSVRTIFGSRQVNMPSEFINDIDDYLYEAEIHPGTGLKTISFD